MSIFKDCDIRGVYGEELTEAVMERIGRAVALRLQGRSIVVGGDFRTHTPPLKAALIRGLTEGGAEVWDAGQLSTPQLYFSKRYLEAWASAQVTASHNPPQYNGLKLMFGALPVQPEDLQALKADVDGERGGRGAGRVRPVDTADAYRQMLKSAYTAGRADLRVVVDAGNGAMSEIAPQVLGELGLQVEPLFCAYDGRFPNRDPNPAATAHLRQLCQRVRECRADFGVAFDGDGDRAIFVDGGGDPLTAEEAMVILIRHSVQPGDSVVYDLKCSSILPRAVEERGGCPIMERSGHAFIRRHFLQAESRLAGEVSGHYFFRELGGDDGLYALVRMASIVAQEGRPIRRLLDGVRYPAVTPDLRIRATAAEIEQTFDHMERWAADSGARVTRLDGIRLDFPDGSWALLRRSITEPAFTVRLEAPEQSTLEALRTAAAQKLGLTVQQLGGA